jgi:diguanylate cyclase (GGDEF)-like protein
MPVDFAACQPGRPAALARTASEAVDGIPQRPRGRRRHAAARRHWRRHGTGRHIDRLDRDASVGTLLLVDIDDLRRVNLTLGRARGDHVLIQLVAHLCALVRPSDVVARVGADEFAVWQDGMDHLTAAERAEALCSRRLFPDLPDGHGVTFSIGIASREPGSDQDVRTLLRRAHIAAREVKATGGGGWRVSHTQPTPRFSDKPS